MGFVVYSTRSKDKIVHLPHCGVIRRIDKKNRRSFESLETARKHGYRMCCCCSTFARKYRAEQNEIELFCKENQLMFAVKNNNAHIISRHDCWRIIVDDKQKLALYHKNTDRSRIGINSIVPGFHYQDVQSKTIMGYLKYIAEHDFYRDEHPCTERIKITAEKGTKRYRKELKEKKRQNRIAEVIRVQALIEELQIINR